MSLECQAVRNTRERASHYSIVNSNETNRDSPHTRARAQTAREKKRARARARARESAKVISPYSSCPPTKALRRSSLLQISVSSWRSSRVNFGV